MKRKEKRRGQEGHKYHQEREKLLTAREKGICSEFYTFMTCYLILKGRRPLGRPRRKWEDNIKMDLREVGWGAQTGLIWLRIGTGGGLLCIR
jgi:hypothetical protein